eukprot:gene6111-5964_t
MPDGWRTSLDRLLEISTSIEALVKISPLRNVMGE